MDIVRRLSGRKFKAWLVAQRREQREAADDLGVSPLTICRICNGRQSPTDELKFKIWIYTCGAIEPNHWFDLDPAQLGGDGAEAPDPMEAAA